MLKLDPLKKYQAIVSLGGERLLVIPHAILGKYFFDKEESLAIEVKEVGADSRLTVGFYLRNDGIYLAGHGNVDPKDSFYSNLITGVSFNEFADLCTQNEEVQHQHYSSNAHVDKTVMPALFTGIIANFDMLTQLTRDFPEETLVPPSLFDTEQTLAESNGDFRDESTDDDDDANFIEEPDYDDEDTDDN